MNLNPYLDVAPEVAAAVAAGKPVVALESTIISQDVYKRQRHGEEGAQAVPLSQGHPYGEAAKGQEIRCV